MKNLKTTLCGVAVLIAAVALIYVGQTIVGVAIIPVGIGLINAKDDNVTGGTKQQ
jgi:hypothetical protein